MLGHMSEIVSHVKMSGCLSYCIREAQKRQTHGDREHWLPRLGVGQGFQRVDVRGLFGRMELCDDWEAVMAVRDWQVSEGYTHSGQDVVE